MTALSVTEPQAFSIGSRTVGPNEPCFVIAEAGVNHNGCLLRAKDLIDAAAEAGADAVKFQTFRAETLVTEDAPQAAYQQRNTGGEQSQFEMLKALELSQADHEALIRHCEDRNILFMSTPFDEASADQLADLGIAVFKTPSGELTNGPFLEHVARLGRPLIVSTGMGTLGEVEAAVAAIKRSGNDEFAILHCVSNYPADPADVNLRAMGTLQAAFGKPVGYSDHTLGLDVGLASVALGAAVLEKHFTLDRDLPGPDHKASLEPAELKQLCDGIRVIESALGDGCKRPAACEADTAAVARKSLVTTIPIAAGARITADALTAKRPGTGLPPDMRSHVIDRTAAVDLPAGHVICWKDVA